MLTRKADFRDLVGQTITKFELQQKLAPRSVYHISTKECKHYIFELSKDYLISWSPSPDVLVRSSITGIFYKESEPTVYSGNDEAVNITAVIFIRDQSVRMSISPGVYEPHGEPYTFLQTTL